MLIRKRREMGELRRSLDRTEVRELNARVLDLLLADRIGQARPLAEKSHSLAVATLKPTDPEYVVAFNRLATVRFNERKTDEARQLLEQVIATAYILGETDMEYAALLNNLATCYVRCDRSAEAIPLYERAIHAKREIYGAGSLSYIANLQDLVAALETLGRYADAEPYLREMLAMVGMAVGEESPEYAQVRGELGRVCRNAGKTAEGDELLSRAEDELRRPTEEILDVLSSTENKSGTSPVDKARLAYANGDFRQARRLHREILDPLPRLPLPDIFEAALGSFLDPLREDIDRLESQGMASEAAGDYDAAAHAYSQIIEMVRVSFGDQHPHVAAALNNLALVRQKQRRYDGAKVLFREAIAILGDGVRQAELGDDLLINIARLYMDICDAVAPWPGDDLDSSLSDLKRKPEAFTVATRARFPLPIENEDAVNNTRRWLDARAKWYQSIGDLTRARFVYENAVEMMRLAWGGQPAMLLEPIQEFAEFAIANADYETASKLLEEGCQIAEEAHGPASDERATFSRMLVQALVQIGDYDAAERSILATLDAMRGRLGDDHPNIAILEDDLLVIRLRKGDHAGARELLDKKLASLGDDLEDIDPNELQRFGAFATQAKDFASAERLLRTALARLEETKGAWDPAYALTLSNLGTALRLTGRFEEAASCFRQSLEIRKTWFGADHQFVAQSQIRLALTLTALGEYAPAFEAVSDALRIGDTLIAGIVAVGSERQLLALLHEQRTALDLGLSIAARLPDSTTASYEMVLKRKALSGEALIRRRQPLLAGRYPRLEERLEELNELTALIARAHMAAAPARPKDLDRASRRRDRLEEELVRAIPELRLGRAAFTSSQIGEAVPEDAALIEYIRFTRRDFSDVDEREIPATYVAYVIQRSRPIVLIDLGDAERVDRAIENFGELISGRAAQFPGKTRADASAPSQEAGRRLREYIFDPVVRALSGKTRLFIAPDGPLALLPLDSLALAGDRFVIDDYHISYLATGRDMIQTNDFETNRAPAVIVAGPDYDLDSSHAESDVTSFARSLQGLGLDLPPLPGATAEGREVAAILKTPQILQGTAAVKSAIRALRSPVILHFATHGFYMPEHIIAAGKDQMRLQADGAMIASALALAGANTFLRGDVLPEQAEDGILTAEDVATLNLLGTSLVVLSACNSGVGAVVPGEGVFGLRRAFFAAGARSVVMSLWQLPDVETRLLMKLFYEELRRGASKSDALRRAKLSMRHSLVEPFYWGSFICEGDWGTVPSEAFASD
jgi:CHAT domain-containing protein